VVSDYLQLQQCWFASFLRIAANGLFLDSPLRVCWVPHTDFSKAPGHLESLEAIWSVVAFRRWWLAAKSR